MTLFEYLAIAYSLIISFAVMRVAIVLPHALAPGRRYWVHATWILLNLVLSLAVFWNFWSFRDVTWTLGRFSLGLSVPTAVLIIASILAPEQAAQVKSWRDHFYKVRVRLLAAGFGFAFAVILTSTLLLGVPLVHPLRVAQGFMLGAFATGAYSESPRVQAALAALCLAVTTAVLLIFGEPGSFRL